MAVVQINEYSIADVNFEALMDSVNDQRIGYMRVSLTQIGTSTVPAVAAGSVFECNGGLYNSSSQTALGGAPADGRVWIYFDPSTLAFTMTATAPTWSDSKNGWYGTSGTANCRYLPFVMDKSGANYTNKRWLVNDNACDIITLETGTNEDKTLQFASDASILWDESQDEFVINKDVSVTGTLDVSGNVTVYETDTTPILILGNRTEDYVQIQCNDTQQFLEINSRTNITGALVTTSYIETEDHYILSDIAKPVTPTSGGRLYCKSGALYYLGSSGTETKLANA